MLSACRKCGALVDMTAEEAYTPIWCCSESDRLCFQCWDDEIARKSENTTRINKKEKEIKEEEA